MNIVMRLIAGFTAVNLNRRVANPEAIGEQSLGRREHETVIRRRIHDEMRRE